MQEHENADDRASVTGPLDDADPFSRREEMVLPDWFTAIEQRWNETGDPLLLPTDELSDSAHLCERLFLNEQEAFNAGLAAGAARR